MYIPTKPMNLPCFLCNFPICHALVRKKIEKILVRVSITQIVRSVLLKLFDAICHFISPYLVCIPILAAKSDLTFVESIGLSYRNTIKEVCNTINVSFHHVFGISIGTTGMSYKAAFNPP